MNLKLCTMAATIWGLQSISSAHRSIKPRTLKSGKQGQTVGKQNDNLGSLEILAVYNQIRVESNLK